MAAIGNYFLNVMQNLLSSSTNDDTPSTPQPDRRGSYESGVYQPSVGDVLAVKEILLIKEKYYLPPELVDTIIDFAEYWPRTTARTKDVRVLGSRDEENKFLLRTFPLGHVESGDVADPYQILEGQKYHLEKPAPWNQDQEIPSDATEEILDYWLTKSIPRGQRCCRKVVFKIKSHDQGWGGDRRHQGSYKGSYTWFDVGLERVSAQRKSHQSTPAPRFQLGTPSLKAGSDPKWSDVVCSFNTLQPDTESVGTSDERLEFHHSLLPSENLLQKNRTADKSTGEYVIVWRPDDNIDPESVEGQELSKMGRGMNTGNGEFVRNLKVGDAITIWGKARFPGWTNVVEELQVDVYWAV